MYHNSYNNKNMLKYDFFVCPIPLFGILLVQYLKLIIVIESVI